MLSSLPTRPPFKPAESVSVQNCDSIFVQFGFSSLMEIQPPPIKSPPSPTTSSGAAVLSSETMSQHSSPAKTSRVHYHHPQMSQVTSIDESTARLPLSVSAHHQLVAALGSPMSASQQPSISGISGLQLQVQHQHQVRQQHTTTQTTHTGHLALLYHSSSHHHHLHHVLPPVRRPSRLPPPVYVRPPEIKA